MITEIPSGLKKTFYVFKIKNKIEINYHLLLKIFLKFISYFFIFYTIFGLFKFYFSLAIEHKH